MAQQHPEPIFRVVTTSPIMLPPGSGLRRTGDSTHQRRDGRPPEVGDDFLLFDVFVSGPRLILSGPPLEDLTDDLTTAEWTVDGTRVEPHLEDVLGTQRSWIDLGERPVGTLRVAAHGTLLAAEPVRAETGWFADKRVLLTRSKISNLDWLVDWATFYTARHEVNAVLLYSDPSDGYTSREILSRLVSVGGLEAVVVVEWPYGFGRSSGDEAGTTGEPDAAECGLLEHARLRFLGRAAGVVQQDLDELLLTVDGRPVFDHVAESPEAAISYPGRYIENVSTEISDPPRFGDFYYYDIRRGPARHRWAIDPRRASEPRQWLPDSIPGVEAAHANKALYRRFVGMTTDRASARSAVEAIDPAAHALDRDLRAALGRGPYSADRPADRAARPRETLSRLATLINPKQRVAAGFQKLWFFRDDLLTLEYQTSDGIRYAFDFRATERGINVSILGRDDSSRHSVRKRCGSFGKLTDSNRRIELAWWRHSTSIDTVALDAVAHLQRANTAMSAATTWAPPRSIPSYWWDHRMNFGDLIGPWIVEMLAGRPTHNTVGLPNAGDALVGVGSLITSLQRPGTTIWGSGLIAPLDPKSRQRLTTRVPKRILAVRGKRTRAELVNHLGWDVPEVYGDPALLMDRLYTPPATTSVTAAYSICPHYVHMKDIAGSADRLGDAHLIDVERDAETVVAEIAHSQAVISTSLHGLIVAQAYGVPWVWLRIDDKRLAGDTFKFEDFFTTLDREAVASATVTREELRSTDFATIAKSARVPRSKFDAKALVDAFPYPVVQTSAIQ